MQRDGFIFYNSYASAARGMSPKDRLSFYDALVAYAIEGQEPARLSKIASIAFVLCKPQVDANNLRYTNGCKGGRPKKTDGFEIEKPMVLETGNQTLETEKPKYKYKEKEKEKYKENISIKEDGNFEEKEIYKKFFFNNFLNPSKEVRRYMAWGDSTGWVKQSGRPITNRISYAGFWKPEDEGLRFQPISLKILLLAYQKAWGEKNHSAAEAVFCISRDKVCGENVDFYGGTEAAPIAPYIAQIGADLGLKAQIHASV